MANHSFDTSHAEAFGIEAAILIFNIDYWIKKNKANKKNFYEGRYWTYNSIQAWKELFPYITSSVIRKRLDYLAEKGIIIKGNFNENRSDRTTWFSIDYEKLNNLTICLPGQMDLSPRTNGFVSPDKSSISTDINTDIKHSVRIDSKKLILPFETESFLTAWNEWEQFRKEKRQKLTPSSIKKQFKFLREKSESDAIAIIDQSIKNGWTGLFEIKNTKPNERKNTASAAILDDQSVPRTTW